MPKYGPEEILEFVKNLKDKWDRQSEGTVLKALDTTVHLSDADVAERVVEDLLDVGRGLSKAESSKDYKDSKKNRELRRFFRDFLGAANSWIDVIRKAKKYSNREERVFEVGDTVFSDQIHNKIASAKRDLAEINEIRKYHPDWDSLALLEKAEKNIFFSLLNNLLQFKLTNPEYSNVNFFDRSTGNISPAVGGGSSSSSAQKEELPFIVFKGTWTGSTTTSETFKTWDEARDHIKKFFTSPTESFNAALPQIAPYVDVGRFDEKYKVAVDVTRIGYGEPIPTLEPKMYPRPSEWYPISVVSPVPKTERDSFIKDNYYTKRALLLDEKVKEKALRAKQLEDILHSKDKRLSDPELEEYVSLQKNLLEVAIKYEDLSYPENKETKPFEFPFLVRAYRDNSTVLDLSELLRSIDIAKREARLEYLLPNWDPFGAGKEGDSGGSFERRGLTPKEWAPNMPDGEVTEIEDAFSFLMMALYERKPVVYKGKHIEGSSTFVPINRDQARSILKKYLPFIKDISEHPNFPAERARVVNKLLRNFSTFNTTDLEEKFDIQKNFVENIKDFNELVAYYNSIKDDKKQLEFLFDGDKKLEKQLLSFVDSLVYKKPINFSVSFEANRELYRGNSKEAFNLLEKEVERFYSYYRERGVAEKDLLYKLPLDLLLMSAQASLNMGEELEQHAITRFFSASNNKKSIAEMRKSGKIREAIHLAEDAAIRTGANIARGTLLDPLSPDSEVYKSLSELNKKDLANLFNMDNIEHLVRNRRNIAKEDPSVTSTDYKAYISPEDDFEGEDVPPQPTAPTEPTQSSPASPEAPQEPSTKEESLRTEEKLHIPSEDFKDLIETFHSFLRLFGSSDREKALKEKLDKNPSDREATEFFSEREKSVVNLNRKLSNYENKYKKEIEETSKRATFGAEGGVSEKEIEFFIPEILKTIVSDILTPNKEGATSLKNFLDNSGDYVRVLLSSIIERSGFSSQVVENIHDSLGGIVVGASPSSFNKMDYEYPSSWRREEASDQPASPQEPSTKEESLQQPTVGEETSDVRYMPEELVDIANKLKDLHVDSLVLVHADNEKRSQNHTLKVRDLVGTTRLTGPSISEEEYWNWSREEAKNIEEKISSLVKQFNTIIQKNIVEPPEDPEYDNKFYFNRDDLLLQNISPVFTLDEILQYFNFFGDKTKIPVPNRRENYDLSSYQEAVEKIENKINSSESQKIFLDYESKSMLDTLSRLLNYKDSTEKNPFVRQYILPGINRAIADTSINYENHIYDRNKNKDFFDPVSFLSYSGEYVDEKKLRDVVEYVNNQTDKSKIDFPQIENVYPEQAKENFEKRKASPTTIEDANKKFVEAIQVLLIEEDRSYYHIRDNTRRNLEPVYSRFNVVDYDTDKKNNFFELASYIADNYTKFYGDKLDSTRIIPVGLSSIEKQLNNAFRNWKKDRAEAILSSVALAQSTSPPEATPELTPFPTEPVATQESPQESSTEGPTSLSVAEETTPETSSPEDKLKEFLSIRAELEAVIRQADEAGDDLPYEESVRFIRQIDDAAKRLKEAADRYDDTLPEEERRGKSRRSIYFEDTNEEGEKYLEYVPDNRVEDLISEYQKDPASPQEDKGKEEEQKPPQQDPTPSEEPAVATVDTSVDDTIEEEVSTPQQPAESEDTPVADQASKKTLEDLVREAITAYQELETAKQNNDHDAIFKLYKKVSEVSEEISDHDDPRISRDTPEGRELRERLFPISDTESEIIKIYEEFLSGTTSSTPPPQTPPDQGTPPPDTSTPPPDQNTPPTPDQGAPPPDLGSTEPDASTPTPPTEPSVEEESYEKTVSPYKEEKDFEADLRLVNSILKGRNYASASNKPKVNEALQRILNHINSLEGLDRDLAITLLDNRVGSHGGLQDKIVRSYLPFWNNSQDQSKPQQTSSTEKDRVETDAFKQLANKEKLDNFLTDLVTYAKGAKDAAALSGLKDRLINNILSTNWENITGLTPEDVGGRISFALERAFNSLPENLRTKVSPETFYTTLLSEVSPTEAPSFRNVLSSTGRQPGESMSDYVMRLASGSEPGQTAAAAKQKAEEQREAEQKAEEQREAEKQAKEAQEAEDLKNRLAQEQATLRQKTEEEERQSREATEESAKLAELEKMLSPLVGGKGEKKSGVSNFIRNMIEGGVKEGSFPERAIISPMARMGGILSEAVFRTLTPENQMRAIESGNAPNNPTLVQAAKERYEILKKRAEAEAPAEGAKGKAFFDRMKESSLARGAGRFASSVGHGAAGLAAYKGIEELLGSLVAGKKKSLGEAAGEIGFAGLTGAGLGALSSLPGKFGKLGHNLGFGAMEALQDEARLNTIARSLDKPDDSMLSRAAKYAAGYANPAYWLEQAGFERGSKSNVALDALARTGLYSLPGKAGPALLGATMAGQLASMAIDPFVERVAAQGKTEYEAPEAITPAAMKRYQEVPSFVDYYLKQTKPANPEELKGRIKDVYWTLTHPTEGNGFEMDPNLAHKTIRESLPENEYSYLREALSGYTDTTTNTKWGTPVDPEESTPIKNLAKKVGGLLGI